MDTSIPAQGVRLTQPVPTIVSYVNFLLWTDRVEAIQRDLGVGHNVADVVDTAKAEAAS